MVTQLLIFSLIVISAFLQILFLRKVTAECKKNSIQPPGAFNFWYIIDDVWKKRKQPGMEKLNSALIKLLLSWIGFFVCFTFLAVNMN